MGGTRWSAPAAPEADPANQGLEDAGGASGQVGDGALHLVGVFSREAFDLLLFEKQADVLLDLEQELAVLWGYEGAMPFAPLRAVRPMRWTYSSGISGMS
jgi:hypothetical protein